jgi:hypothetical protein
MSLSSEWICEYLPEVFIDIDQGGNLRKSDEAESCYKLCAIGYVLKDFIPKIMEFIEGYDFETMSFIDDTYSKSLKKHLQYFQDMNSSRVNAIISAASLKISSYKEKNESFYIGLLKPNEISELSTLSRNIKAVIAKYEREEGLNPLGMKDMTKIRKLTLIDKRDLEIEELISKSSVAVYYRISKLTSERIPPVIKSRILEEADRAAQLYVKDNNLTGFEAIDSENKIRKLIVKEGYRAVLKNIKSEEVLKYKKDPARYVFKRKS